MVCSPEALWGTPFFNLSSVSGWFETEGSVTRCSNVAKNLWLTDGLLGRPLHAPEPPKHQARQTSARPPRPAGAGTAGAALPELRSRSQPERDRRPDARSAWKGFKLFPSRRKVEDWTRLENWTARGFFGGGPTGSKKHFTVTTQNLQAIAISSKVHRY